MRSAGQCESCGVVFPGEPLSRYSLLRGDGFPFDAVLDDECARDFRRGGLWVQFKGLVL